MQSDFAQPWLANQQPEEMLVLKSKVAVVNGSSNNVLTTKVHTVVSFRLVPSSLFPNRCLTLKGGNHFVAAVVIWYGI